jgi:hypothetical protein
MASNWQFFLQKKGSRSWNRITSSTFNLPEGVYRIVASTKLKNKEIKVCVLHQYMNKGESKQRFYTSSHLTDDQGILPILPFTDLKPEVWQLFTNFREDGPPEETLVISIQPTPLNSSQPQLQIVLNQEHFILESDENSVLISGIVKYRQNIEELTEPFEGKLYYQLRNPQTGEILLSNEENILGQLPHSFQQIINNINWPLELILGELILVEQNSTILTRKSFSITINLEQLLHQGKYKRYNNHVELFRFDKSATKIEKFNHSNGQILPPKIPSNHLFQRTKIIDLPKFSQPQTQKSTTTLNKHGYQPEHNSAFCLSQVKPKSPKIDQEFASLNLENRFFSRLYNLALLTQNNQKILERSSVSEEIPVFREEISTIITHNQLDSLSVPTPILTVLSEEIKAGNWLEINITLPNYTNDISVKIWLQDRQTRAIIIEPIYIYGFLLNVDQQLETTTKITIPGGSVEVLLEAIAIDQKTKRESYKTSLILPVSF